MPRCHATLQIRNRLGLHARAAAKVVSVASRHEARIILSVAQRHADAKSIMALLTLAAAQGTEVEVCAEGAEADAAMAELADLFARRFDEAE